MYKKEYVQTFLEKQGQLFDEPVADDFEEAEAFLEDCMAVVLDSLKDVKKYLDGMGADVEGLSLKELEEEKQELHPRKLNMVNLHQQRKVCKNLTETQKIKNDVKEDGI